MFPGMASEVETLSPEERAALVASLGQKLAGRVPFIVGASDADPARAAARAREGRDAGASAAMVMAPERLGLRYREAYRLLFRRRGGRRDRRSCCRTRPRPWGPDLAPAQVAAIAKAVPGVRYVKEETLPCGQNVTRILDAAGGDIDAVFGGAGARFMMDELARGAAGTMPALEIADIHVRMWKAFKAGDVAKARRLYNVTLPLLCFQMVFRIRSTKEVLKRRGIAGADTCARGRARAGRAGHERDRRAAGGCGRRIRAGSALRPSCLTVTRRPSPASANG